MKSNVNKNIIKNRDGDTTRELQSEIRVRNEEIEILKREYSQFVKLSFSGLVGGIIGLIITGVFLVTAPNRYAAVKINYWKK